MIDDLWNCRTLPVNRWHAEAGNVSFEDTTCGKDAFFRGRGQKVVGFSFYGDINSNKSIEKGYFEGIVENLKLIRVYYPGKRTWPEGGGSSTAK